MNNYRIISTDCVVVGTGAAGYNAANRIKKINKKDVIIVTESVNCGTSRNTGSDKQTYYKLSLGGDTTDSVYNMAKNLFDCGSVDGDTALCESALSVRSFLNLCELGVPFPHNRYGEYIGYKTDHDPYARAASAGPLTSKFMTEALENQAKDLGVRIERGLLAVEILKYKEQICGLIALDTETGGLVAFNCPNIILATGGPAGIYADSAYPLCHTGSTGLALLAGAHLQNMTEWQYGLASVNPRWNVSGTYMQVLPRFVSVDKNGNECEFLLDFFGDKYAALSSVFLKGYQWPFDSKKVLDGSSVIDLLVYRECIIKGNKVYLDYTKNPFGLGNIDFNRLSGEAHDYLCRANAAFGTPIERLKAMNTPAIELYASKGLDITKEPLQISLCVQHNNGGISVDLWWQTNIKGLFAAGECAGTHGITRPGGSALNSGQVGSLRAAQYISASSRKRLSDKEFKIIADNAVSKQYGFCEKMLQNKSNTDEKTALFQRRMSDCAAAVRDVEKIREYKAEVLSALKSFEEIIGADKKHLFKAYKLKDILYTQSAVLSAAADYNDTVGTTRGSALNYDKSGALRDGLDEWFRLSVDGDNSAADKIQEVYLENEDIKIFWRKVRPIPDNDNFFENVWRTYRENENIF